MDWVGNSPTGLRSRLMASRYPSRTTPAGLNVRKVWTLPSSLAATGGIAFAFCSSGY
jgi:hypothetical protein